MAATIYQEITNAGGTFTYDPSLWGDGTTLFLYSNSAITLAAGVDIVITSLPPAGTTIIVNCAVGINSIDLNGQTFKINGYTVAQWLIDNPFNFVIQSIATGLASQQLFISFIDANNGGISGAYLLDGSIPLDKLEDLTAAQIIVGDATNRPTAVAPSGAVSMTNAGVFSIVAGYITNAMINAAAAIAWTKMAALTASKVVVTSAGGIITTANQLLANLGGTGIDTSASTGFPTVSAGTWSVGAVTGSIVVPVSFEAASQCQNKVKFPFACTITGIYATVTTALAATDAGTITPKDGSGTNITLSSPLSFPASSALNTALDVTASANNIVAANDIITLLTAKTTGGGAALVTITYTRVS